MIKCKNARSAIPNASKDAKLSDSDVETAATLLFQTQLSIRPIIVG
jgi:hypothetical protein